MSGRDATIKFLSLVLIDDRRTCLFLKQVKTKSLNIHTQTKLEICYVVLTQFIYFNIFVFDCYLLIQELFMVRWCSRDGFSRKMRSTGGDSLQWKNRWALRRRCTVGSSRCVSRRWLGRKNRRQCWWKAL